MMYAREGRELGVGCGKGFGKQGANDVFGEGGALLCGTACDFVARMRCIKANLEVVEGFHGGHKGDMLPDIFLVG